MASSNSKRLGDLTAVCYRYPTFYGFEYQDSGILVLKGENITRDGELIEVDEPNYISKEVHDKYPNTHLALNDLVMSVRGEVGKVGLVDQRFTGANINANTIRISLKHEVAANQALPRFVWAVFNSKIGASQIRRLVSGGVQETITAPEILDILIPIPPLPIQLAMVAEMDAARIQRNRKLEEAVVLLSGLDAFLLDHLGLSMPKSANRLTYAIRLSAIQVSKQIGADYFHPERINALRAIQTAKKAKRFARLDEIADFHRDIETEYDPEQYLGLAGVQSQTGELAETSEEPGQGQSFRYCENDVLYARLRPYLNKVWRAERDGVCSTEFHVIHIKKEMSDLLPDYLSAVLRSSVVVSQTKHMMTGNTHPRLANEDVVDLLIPIPDEKVQREIVEELHKRRMKARKLREEAVREWDAAKAQFEAKLLGTEVGNESR